METKEIIEIITGILAGVGLTICCVAGVYCICSMAITDRQIKRVLQRMEKEE